MGNFKSRAAFAFEGFSARASEWWLAAIGGVVGWVILWFSGLQNYFDSVLPSNALVANAIVIVICVALGELLMLALRFAYFPLHQRTKPYGGIVPLARSKLGTLMVPIALIISAMFAFVFLLSAGLIWLLLTLPDKNGKNNPIYNSENAAQPDLEFSVPDKRMILRWNSERSFQIGLRYDGESGNSFSFPYIVAKIKNNISIADITVRWRAEISDIKDLIDKSKILRETNKDYSDNRVNIYKSGRVSYSYAISPVSSEYNVPFINNLTKLSMPVSVYDITSLYLLTQMPEKAGERSYPITFSIFIHWSIPSGGKDKEFKITATVTNTKTIASESIAAGEVDFDVVKVR